MVSDITNQWPDRRLSQLFEISQQLEALAESIPSNSPLPQVLLNIIFTINVIGSNIILSQSPLPPVRLHVIVIVNVIETIQKKLAEVHPL